MDGKRLTDLIVNGGDVHTVVEKTADESVSSDFWPVKDMLDGPVNKTEYPDIFQAASLLKVRSYKDLSFLNSEDSTSASRIVSRLRNMATKKVWDLDTGASGRQAGDRYQLFYGDFLGVDYLYSYATGQSGEASGIFVRTEDVPKTDNW